MTLCFKPSIKLGIKLFNTNLGTRHIQKSKKYKNKDNKRHVVKPSNTMRTHQSSSS